MVRRKKKRVFLPFDSLTSEVILRNMPFILFLGFLAVIYIANSHYAERNVRQIQTLQKEIKELRWYYMSLQAENMYNSKRTEIVDRVRRDGLKPLEDQPKIIVVDRETETLR